MIYGRTFFVISLVAALLLGCASPAIDDGADPLIATQEQTSQPTAEATTSPSLSVTRMQSADEPTIAPERTEQASQPTATTVPTPASDLQSEGLIWDFGEQGYAYVYEGNLCLNTGGHPVLLGEASDTMTVTDPSPNGLWIAYQRKFPIDGDAGVFQSEVRIARTNGSQNIIAWTSEKLQEKYPAAGTQFANIRWMPSSSQLLFSTAHQFFGLAIPNADLYRYDATVPELVGLIPRLRTDDYSMFYSSLSPDGQWVALWDYDSLSFMRTDGGVYREDAFTFQWEPQPCEALPTLNPVWEADSSGVTFVVKGWAPPDPSIDLSTFPIPNFSSWFVPVSGEAVKLGEFSSELMPFKSCMSWEGVAISPDLQWIGYAFPYPNYIVGLIRTDGTQQITLLQEESELHGRTTQLTWLDNEALRFALEANAAQVAGEGESVRTQRRAYTATLDGTVTPTNDLNPPENPLISCAP